MRKVDRSATKCPSSMMPNGIAKTEHTKVKQWVASKDPKKKLFTYKAYKADDVKAALEALFHGKCAYCETVYAASASVDVEHYRPKGAVAEDPGHSGYWWIAMAWENLLPSCNDCNRQRDQEVMTVSTSLSKLAIAAKPTKMLAGKKDSFPIAAAGVRALAEATDFAAELPLLLNPCVDDPARSLAYSFDPSHPTGLILPSGATADQERGAVSIQVYGLNRLKLVQDRTRLLRRLEFLGDLVIDLSGLVMDLEEPASITQLQGTAAEGIAKRLRLLRDRTLVEMKSLGADDQPYSSMVRAWLDTFKKRIASGSL